MSNLVSRQIPHLLSLATALALAVSTAAAQQPTGSTGRVLDAGDRRTANRIDAGTVRIQEPFEHTFHFRNDSPEPIDIAGVELEPPLVAVGGTSRVAPGEAGRLVVRLGQPREKGRFDKQIVVRFKQPSAGSRTFVLSGTVVPPIELKPAHGFYVVAQRGQIAERSIELVNHESEPLEIARAEYEGARFAPTVETLESGRRYRITLRTSAAAPAGRVTESIRLVRANSTRPPIAIQANVWIKERVYAFPESLDLGTINSKSSADSFTQSLMVYQVGGMQFHMTAGTDVPFLDLAVAESPFGDRFKITASLMVERATPGPIQGSIVVQTNDPEFPTLVVPVRGVIR